MPLFKEWKPNLHSLAAIWHISEAEDFFERQLSISGKHIAHPKRRIEFLAGRFLLQQLNKDFPVHAIIKDEQEKPQLPNQEFHFSISHSFPFVACVLSTESSVCIDIQCWQKSMLAIQSKFLSPTEQLYCDNKPEKITLAWTAKEAAYKYQGRRGVAFIEHLPITDWQEKKDFFNITINLKLSNPIQPLILNSFIFNDFALSIACS